MPPSLVLLLTLVTLGIYAFAYWWSASRQVDAHVRPALPSHARVRRGCILMLASILPHLVASVLLVGAGADTFDDEPRPRGFADPLFVGGAIALILAWLLTLAGLVLVGMGLLRLWRILRDEDVARSHPRPLRPGVQLLLVAFPYVNLVGMWFVLYRTQTRLNRMWDGAAPA